MTSMKLGSPIGLMIRGPDRWAREGGAWHALRARHGRPRRREGVDVVTVPGQPIVAPVPAIFVRPADPYPDAEDGILSGALLRTAVGGVEIKIFYCEMAPGIRAGRSLKQGEPFAIAQSLQHLYPGIQDHIHVEIRLASGERIDPTPWFFRVAAARPPAALRA